MASALNKRQQARNERALQDLIRNVPGNDRCADCAARNPGWASWSLGIFICMRCATLHRKLGTHISKVKSLSMDSWSNDQVDHMKRVGNVNSNRLYNPNNTKPQIPVDVDEVDGAMERFIRQKYEHKAFSGESRPTTRHNTGSTSSAEDKPPPLPPKPGHRFGLGLRKASAPADVTSPPISPGLSGFGDGSPPRVNKASRVFGHNVRSGSADSFESKLQTLKDMGFQDEKRNTTVLKGLNGNLEKSVETLIRLGEGGRSMSSSASGVQTPVSSNSEHVNGLSIGRTRPAPSSSHSNNPFDNLGPVQPSFQQQPPPLQMQEPQLNGYGSPSNPYNPFIPPQQAPMSAHPGLEQSFQNLQVSQPQQPAPLFPNHTGGPGNPSLAQQPYNPFMQSFTPPPVPQIPSQFQAPMQHPQQTGFQQSQASNPFLKTSRSQIFTPSNPFNAQVAGAPTGQNFQQSLQQGQQFFQNQLTVHSPVEQRQSQSFSGPSAGYQQPQQQFQTPGQYQQFQQQQQPGQFANPYLQQQQQYQLPRHNKTSILALYNAPHLAPQPTGAPPVNSAESASGVPQRSVTMPITSSTQGDIVAAPGSHNPFAQQPAAQRGGGAGGARHVSQESVDFSGLMSGRHSPDAFAGLSSGFR